MSEPVRALTLTLLSVLAGAGALWVFGRFSNQAAITQARKKLRAHIYELTLFAHDPVLIWRAQKHLLAWNARYLALALKPAVILTIPMVLLLINLDAVYGRRPLRPGETTLVTAQFGPSVDLNAEAPQLDGPAGVSIESPAVCVPAEHRVYWRVKAAPKLDRPPGLSSRNALTLQRQARTPVSPGASGAGPLRIHVGEREFEKSFHTGSGFAYVPARRVASRWQQLLHPGEPLLRPGAIEWIEVDYPGADVSIFGWHVHWLWWFFIVSMLAAFLLRKRMHVTF